MDTAKRIIEICKERKIAISTLERDCGFANAYIKGRVGGKIPSDRVKKIAEYLHVHPSELDPTMFSSAYSNPKYDGIIKRLSEDKTFEDTVLDFYSMSSDDIMNLKTQYQRLAEYARLITELPSLRMHEDKKENRSE